MGFIHFVNNRGPRLEPWGTPTWVPDRVEPFCEESACSPHELSVEENVSMNGCLYLCVSLHVDFQIFFPIFYHFYPSL